MNGFLRIPILFLLAAPLASRAQDYPYDAPEDGAPTDKSELPSEAPPPPRKGQKATDATPQNSGALPALFRVGIKGGAEYAVFQTYGADAVTGPGFSAFFSLGWDLPYQPVFVELEGGFRKLFPTSDSSLLMLPLRFGMYRRMRIGTQSLFKFGVVPSMDLRIQENGDGGTDWSIVPSLAFAVVWEFGGFLIQPEVSIYRIRPSDSRISGGLMVGYRF